eukprot:TRINITY_DN4968_c0_g1_i2.p1 TRINITY_DN4968_c0_g1~~TRINITY_DN4968_c0_g1_i2.p1  ORF type:complete len:696 (+),score=101.26 TRINITY_DN4968_c0_g1_i2:176-2263(+)
MGMSVILSQFTLLLSVCFVTGQDIQLILVDDQWISPPQPAEWCQDVVSAVSQQPTLSTLTSIFQSDALDPQLKSNLNDPSYAAEICAPTDDAFDQFYDRNGIDQSTFFGNPDLVNQVVQANIIPGGLPDEALDDGSSITLDSLLENQPISIFNNGGNIEVSSGGGPVANAIGVDTSACQAGITLLDQVLEPNSIQDLVSDNSQGDCSVSVLDAVDQNPQLSQLAAVFKASNLDDSIRADLNDPNYAAVICAPNDDAFNQFYDRNGIDQSTFLANPDLIDQVVKVNIIPGGLPGGSLPDDGDTLTAPTLSEGQTLDISNRGGSIFVQGPNGNEAQVVDSDTSPCNAAISELDNVLEPQNIEDLLPQQEQCPNVLEAVQANSDLSTLAEVFQAEALEPELKSSLANPDFAAVICAPTNDAFDQFFDSKQTDKSTFLGNPDLLNQVVKINIIPGGLPGGQPPDEGEQYNAPTLLDDQQLTIQNSGDTLFVSGPAGPTVTVQGASEPSACNAQITLIDGVIQPSNIDALISPPSCPNIVQATEDQPSLSTLAAAFNSDALDDELKSSLTDPSFQATICAPTDDAFDQFFDNSGVDKSTFLSNPDLLNQVMKVNIVPGPPGENPPEGESAVVPTLLPNGDLVIQNVGGDIVVQGPSGPSATVQQVIDDPCESALAVIDQVLLPDTSIFTNPIAIGYNFLP